MPRIAVLPSGVRPFLVDAVRAGGGTVVEDAADADGVVWASPGDAEDLRALLARHANVRWVQLPWAGIEPFVAVLDRDHLWTAGQGVYADPVAEHALALSLAGLRELKRRAHATSWDRPKGDDRGGITLVDGSAVVVGAGGIAQALVPMLAPLRCRVTVVRRRATPFPGAAHTVPLEELRDVVGSADVVILACALTAKTRGIIGARELAAMKNTAVLVNVARGALVDTAALVDALQNGTIGAACLDVTEPEPLPPGHALWSHPRCLITPHVSNTPEMAVPLLSTRVSENVRRYAAGAPMLGVVDVDEGY